MKAYEYKHIVSFEETNLVGNVYFANHVKWQGRVREMFLKDHAPDIIELFKKDLALVTTKVSCEYFIELFALDEILIKMYVTQITQNRVTMKFEYFRKDQLCASGEQQIACMKKIESGIAPEQIPDSLKNALLIYF